MTQTKIITIDKGDKFVGMWGYDQTQYSIYNVVDLKGQFVLVEGLNGWSSLGERDLAVGSKVKIYKQDRWETLTTEEREDWAKRGFDKWSYERHLREKAIENAQEVTITKQGRVNGDKWSYKWELSDGTTFDSTDPWETRPSVEITYAITRRKLQASKWQEGDFYIKIDEVITAHLDKDYDDNRKKYVEQNEYTAYNGR